MSDDTKRSLPEIGGRQVAETALELALSAVGLGPVVGASRSLLQVRDERLVRTYLANVASFMNSASWEDARDYIKDHEGEAWAQEGTARATRAILEGVDDDASRCIAALAANYYERKTVPDLAHKQIANLFANSDAFILESALYVLENLPAAEAAEYQLSSSAKHGRFSWAPRHRGLNVAEETTLPAPPAYPQVFSLLRANGIGHDMNVWGDSPAMIVPATQVSTVHCLVECMRTGGIEAWNEGSDPHV